MALPTTMTQHERYAEVQDALLAWARGRARHPVTIKAGAFACDFCHSQFAFLWDGRTVEGAHAPGCLALRAVAEGVA